MREVGKLAPAEANQRINSGWYRWMQHQNELPIYEAEPLELLNGWRFDVMAKYVYAKFRERGYESRFGAELYREHVRVWNGFHERDGSGKQGEEAYFSCFHEVLDSVKNGAFDNQRSLLPLGDGDILLDGAHRLAACLLYQQNAYCVRLGVKPWKFGGNYFLRKGLARRWCDGIALEMCKVMPDSYIVVVFPSAAGRGEEIRAILQEHGEILYEKQVRLHGQGRLQLIKQLYLGEPWLGTPYNRFAGARKKAERCFAIEGPIRCFAYRSRLERTKQAKDKIRDLFQIGKNSVHINDTHEETARIAQVLFNDNSLHMLNHARHREVSAKFNHLFESYKSALAESGADPDCFCIDSSAVLAAYGLREPNDLDYLHDGYDELGALGPKIASHNGELRYHATTKHDILYNPQHHFHYDGMKFATLDIVMRYKENRREDKDLADIRLIRSLLEPEGGGIG